MRVLACAVALAVIGRSRNHHHAVGRPGPLGLVRDLVAVALPALRIQTVPDRVADLAEAAVAVDDVVGERDDVVAGLAEQVDVLRHRQDAVRVGRVDMKVTEQHANVSIVGLRRQGRSRTRKRSAEGRVRPA